jgi:hypothetical protein
MKRILCIITLFIIILSLSGCGGTASVEVFPSPEASPSASPTLSPEASYGSCSKPLIGIDVSAWQGDIDWKAVSEDNIDFVIIRLGYRGYLEGILHTDDFFEQNIKGAESAGLMKGVYFFSQADSAEAAAEEEAEKVILLLEVKVENSIFEGKNLCAALRFRVRNGDEWGDKYYMWTGSCILVDQIQRDFSPDDLPAPTCIREMFNNFGKKFYKFT